MILSSHGNVEDALQHADNVDNNNQIVVYDYFNKSTNSIKTVADALINIFDDMNKSGVDPGDEKKEDIISSTTFNDNLSDNINGEWYDKSSENHILPVLYKENIDGKLVLYENKDSERSTSKNANNDYFHIFGGNDPDKDIGQLPAEDSELPPPIQISAQVCVELIEKSAFNTPQECSLVNATINTKDPPLHSDKAIASIYARTNAIITNSTCPNSPNIKESNAISEIQSKLEVIMNISNIQQQHQHNSAYANATKAIDLFSTFASRSVVNKSNYIVDNTTEPPLPISNKRSICESYVECKEDEIIIYKGVKRKHIKQSKKDNDDDHDDICNCTDKYDKKRGNADSRYKREDRRRIVNIEDLKKPLIKETNIQNEFKGDTNKQNEYISFINNIENSEQCVCCNRMICRLFLVRYEDDYICHECVINNEYHCKVCYKIKILKRFDMRDDIAEDESFEEEQLYECQNGNHCRPLRYFIDADGKELKVRKTCVLCLFTKSRPANKNLRMVNE